VDRTRAGAYSITKTLRNPPRRAEKSEDLSLTSVQKNSVRYSKLGSFLEMIGKGKIDLFRQAVRNMLAALQIPDVDDNELHDLTDAVA
jgi:hypothetical protein